MTSLCYLLPSPITSSYKHDKGEKEKKEHHHHYLPKEKLNSQFVCFFSVFRVLQRIIIVLILTCNYPFVIYVEDEQNYHV